MIIYKAGYAGKTVHEINRWFPSSKTCSNCDHKLQVLGLDVREWTCSSCGTSHDRDLNAAINILNRGQIDIYDSKQPSRATMEVDLMVPVALMKHAVQIERSGLTTGLHGDEASLTIFSR